MTEETTTPVEKKAEATDAPQKGPEANAGSKPQENSRPQRGGRGGRKPRRGGEREPKEFEESILQIDRVTRVTRGGRQLRFRITVVIGDKKGRVGFGIGKSGEVLSGITKAVADAKKNLINVPCFDDTIPHISEGNFKASKVTIMPAQPGTGIIAGGAVRKILELSGVNNVLSKMHGSRNRLNSAHATFQALGKLENKAPHKPKKAEESSSAKATDDKAKKEKKPAKAEAKKTSASADKPAKKPAAKKPAAKKADKK